MILWLRKHHLTLQLACEKTVSTLQAVLKRTFSYAKGKASSHIMINVHIESVCVCVCVCVCVLQVVVWSIQTQMYLMTFVLDSGWILPSL